MKIHESVDISGITDPNLMAAAINIQKQADSAKATYDNKINMLNNQIIALKNKQQQLNNQKANAKENEAKQNESQTNEAIEPENVENTEEASGIEEKNIIFIMFEYNDETYVYKLYNNGEIWVPRAILNNFSILNKMNFSAKNTKENILDKLSKLFGHVKELNDNEIDNILDTI